MDSLNLKITSAKFTEPKAHLEAILRQWLPLSTAILDLVCVYLPSPLDVTEERVKSLMCSGFRKFESYPMDTQNLKEGFQLLLFVYLCIDLKSFSIRLRGRFF